MGLQLHPTPHLVFKLCSNSTNIKVQYCSFRTRDVPVRSELVGAQQQSGARSVASKISSIGGGVLSSPQHAHQSPFEHKAPLHDQASGTRQGAKPQNGDIGDSESGIYNGELCVLVQSHCLCAILSVPSQLLIRSFLLLDYQRVLCVVCETNAKRSTQCTRGCIVTSSLSIDLFTAPKNSI